MAFQHELTQACCQSIKQCYPKKTCNFCHQTRHMWREHFNNKSTCLVFLTFYQNWHFLFHQKESWLKVLYNGHIPDVHTCIPQFFWVSSSESTSEEPLNVVKSSLRNSCNSFQTGKRAHMHPLYFPIESSFLYITVLTTGHCPINLRILCLVQDPIRSNSSTGVQNHIKGSYK